MRKIGFVLLLSFALSAFGWSQDENRTRIVWTRDLNAARAIAEREWRLQVLFFYGDVAGDGDARKHQKQIDDLFADQKLAGMAREFVGVRVSCHTYPSEARRFGTTKGPMLVVLGPDGRELGKSMSCDSATLVQVLGRFASDYTPSPVSWRPSVEQAVLEARAIRGLVVVAGYEEECTTCAQAQEMLMARRMTLPRRRLVCVRLEKKEDEAKLGAMEVGAFPHLMLIRPGQQPGDPYDVVFSKVWPPSAKALSERIEMELKKLDEQK